MLWYAPTPSRATRVRSRITRPLLLLLLALCGTPALGQGDDPKVAGKWGDVFALPNVPIHAHVLPRGSVMFWGRRQWDPAAGGQPTEGLNPRNTTPWLLDPKTKQSKPLKQPGFNVFCSGHTFLPDGRLFVVGGHIRDGEGEPRAAIYDPVADAWEHVPDTIGGRWYPTAVSLPDGNVLVSFGTDRNANHNNTQQIWNWKKNQWEPNQQFNFPQDVPPWYPRMHVVPDGRVLMSGPLALTQLLDTRSQQWVFLRPDPNPDQGVRLSSRRNRFRDYAPAVMYEVGKVLYVGGGNAPTAAAEVLDLSKQPWGWEEVDGMDFARRHHDATLLPDGSVLVTGGTQGAGGESNGFNDLTPGQPIRSAELWDPTTKQWRRLAKAAVDRCYHSTAVLLPDATVLSAGGGEYSPRNDGRPNDLKDSHRNAQIFSPPYLFGPHGQPATRPAITSAPAAVEYTDVFQVGTPDPSQVGRVTWVRLSSVTHSFNSNQRMNELKFATNPSNPAALDVTAPAEPKGCPPGHYMLFVLNKDGVPSEAKTIRIPK